MKGRLMSDEDVVCEDAKPFPFFRKELQHAD